MAENDDTSPKISTVIEPLPDLPDHHLIGIKVAIISLAYLACGMSLSFPAIGIPALIDAGVALTPTQVSIIGSSRTGGYIFGSLIVGLILDKMGRRKGILISFLPIIAGYAVIAVSDSQYALSIGLVLEGLGLGMMSPSGAVYMAEVFSKEWRGTVSTTRSVFSSLGLTFTYVLGHLIKGNIRVISLIAFAIPLLTFLSALCFISETKVWAKQYKSDVGENQSLKSSCIDFWKALRSRPDVFKPFCILFLINFLRFSSGSSVVLNYTIDIIAHSGTTSDPYAVAIFMGVARIGGSIVTVVLSTFIRRWTISIISGIVMTLSMTGLALNKYLDGLPQFTSETFFGIFIFASVMFLALSLSIQGEMYPTEFRGMGSSSTLVLSNVQSALVIFAYPHLKAWFGYSFVMGTYAVASACIVLTTIFLVPDTDNRTLDEIGRMFRDSGKMEVKDEIMPLQSIKNGESIIVNGRRSFKNQLDQTEPPNETSSSQERDAPSRNSLA